MAVAVPAWVVGAVWALYEHARFQRVLLERTGEDVRQGSAAGRGALGGPPTDVDTLLALARPHRDPEVRAARRRVVLAFVLVLILPFAALAVLGRLGVSA